MDPRQITIETPDLRFQALTLGEGPLILCLHGFPDEAHSFHLQMPALAKAGYRVVAPFMRGYAPSEAARDGRYDVMALGGDVSNLIAALGAERAVVFGHDWGAVAAYIGALLAPDKIAMLVTASVPYGPGFFNSLTTNYAQQRRSWYMMFFQQALSEVAVAHDDFAFIDHLYRDWSPGWQVPAADMARVKECFRAPGTLGAALGYYRAVMGPAFADPAMLDATAQGMSTPIQSPAMMLHGADDGCIGAELVPPMAQHFPNGLRIEILGGAGHFLHREQPERVNTLLLDFLGARA